MKRKTTKLKTHTSFWTPVKTVKYKPRFHTSSPGPVKLNMYPKRSARENRLIMRHPYKDSDRDKVMNYFDCKPLVRKKQDFMSNVEQAKQAAQQAISWTAQNVVKPAAQEGMKAATLVSAPLVYAKEGVEKVYEKLKPVIQKPPVVILPDKFEKYKAVPLPVTPETKYKVMQVAATVIPGAPKPSVSADYLPVSPNITEAEKRALEAARKAFPEATKRFGDTQRDLPMPELPKLPGMPKPGRPEIPEKPHFPIPPKGPELPFNPPKGPNYPFKPIPPKGPDYPTKPIPIPPQRPGPGIPEWYWQQRNKPVPLKK